MRREKWPVLNCLCCIKHFKHFKRNGAEIDLASSPQVIPKIHVKKENPQVCPKTSQDSGAALGGRWKSNEGHSRIQMMKNLQNSDTSGRVAICTRNFGRLAL